MADWGRDVLAIVGAVSVLYVALAVLLGLWLRAGRRRAERYSAPVGRGRRASIAQDPTTITDGLALVEPDTSPDVDGGQWSDGQGEA